MASSSRRRRAAVPPPVTPRPPTAAEERREFTTFRQLSGYDAGNLMWTTPACVNGDVRVRQYRITCELIDEPTEVIHARLVDLWEHSNSHHQADPLRREAARYGLNLDLFDFGSKTRTRKP